ncbi:MAG TPA: hydrogenase expression/formation protein [Anaerolineae bacterium]|nr:hydrogenase expression/formation protein [Anaerolineae bacterium]HIQ06137.1 hydrogenase expression/formation protein [Anaerolineae bacterium]
MLPTGKLPAELLSELLARYGGRDERLIVPPRPGEDAAAIAFSDHVLVAATDPITFATDEIGWYAVHVNANDVAVMGAQPRWFLATALLPEGQATAAMAERIIAQMAQACHDVGAVLAGGHTEITHNLDRPIVIGVMLGEVERARLVRTGGAQPGDAVVQIKPAPIEGTAIIARERREELLARGFDGELLDRAARLLYDPGISVVRVALIAATSATVHAMHDPTEGGLITGLQELAEASGVGLEIHLDAIPVLSEAMLLCNAYGLDPLGTIASGALLVTLPQNDVPLLQAALATDHVQAAVIGRVLPADQGLQAYQDGRPVPFPSFPVDEIARLF